jgi:hypothetical protein
MLYPRNGSEGNSDIPPRRNVLPKLLSYEEYLDVTGGKPIAIWSQFISGVSAINPFTHLHMTSLEERERPYSFILSRKPHETFWFFLLLIKT